MAKHSYGGSSLESGSSLKNGADRFLARVTTHALESGYRTPDDFLRQFRPVELMEALESAPELRKDILVAAGLHEKIARRKTPQSAADDLRIALDESITTAADVLSLIGPDDRVRYLNRAKLFAFAIEDNFFSGQKTGGEHERAVERMLFILECAMGEKLISTADVASAIGFEAISHRLPLKELQKALEQALVLGSRAEAFTVQALFDVVPLRSILSYVPMDQVWSKVVVAKILGPSNLLDTNGKLAPAPESTRDASRRPPNFPPPKPSAPNGKKVEEPRDIRASDAEVDSLLEGSDPARNAPPEEDARRKVVERLQSIARLPPRHAELSTPMLLSIDSMYAELLEAATDEAREECIRESFPNEQHMTQALLALIELLDPSIDINDPVIRDADLESLIKVVLFEERHRYEQRHPASQRPVPSSSTPAPSNTPNAVPPLPPSVRRPTAPPPLPGTARNLTPPPLPPSANFDKQR